MTVYSNVQFIGYAIPTIPLVVGDVGNPNGPGFVEGRYIGIDPPVENDINARIALVMNAVSQTIASNKVETSSSTLKIFVVPEFSFRGTSGAYDNDPSVEDYFQYFRTQFAQGVANATYENWMFVIGTVVTTQQEYMIGMDPLRDLKARVREDLAVAIGNCWQYANTNNDTALANCVFQMLVDYTKYCHADPIYEVYNRAFIVLGGTTPDATYPDGLSVEKKFISNEDFVLNLYTNAFAEEDAAYPDIDEHDGEDKQSAFDPYSIFTIAGIKFGLEVCLDHSRSRLRRNRTPAETVQVHLIPSCGMQIVQQSIIAGEGGLVFNCDGQYDNLDPTSTPNDTDSIWSTTTSGQAHTQLTQVVTPCTGNDPNANMATVRTPPSATVTKIPITDANASNLFAYGPGEVHVYSSLAIPALTDAGGGYL